MKDDPIGSLDWYRRLAEPLGTSGILDAIQGTSALRALALSDYGRLSSVLPTVSVAQQMAAMIRPPHLASVLDSIDSVSRLSRELFPTLGLAGMLPLQTKPWNAVSAISELSRTLGQNRQSLDTIFGAGRLSPATVLSEMQSLQTLVSGLPRWMQPLSPSQLAQPSWALAAGLGAYAGAAPGLVNDVIASLHQSRAKTVAFETLLRSIEIGDSDETATAEQALHLLRDSKEALLDLLGSCKDWVDRQGRLTVLLFLLSVMQTYDGHRSRINSDEQTPLSREQTALARDAATSTPSSAERELSERVRGLEDAIAKAGEGASHPANMRVLSQPALLRETPDKKGHAIRRLYPDDQLLVTSVQGTWARVEVYEYSKEKVAEGWVSRGALRLPR